MKTQSSLPAIPVQFTGANLAIVIAGTLILAIGLYRMFPLQLTRSFFTLNGPLAAMLVIGIGILLWKHDNDSFLKWGKATAIVSGKFLPLMILLCLVMAIGGIITQIHEAAIQSFLLKHRVVGPFVAALVTPTSNALVPVVESSWKNPDLRPMCIFYLQASAQMSIPLFMLRQMGFQDASIIPSRMYAMGVVVSVLMLVFMRPAFWLTEMICEYSSPVWVSLQETVRGWF